MSDTSPEIDPPVRPSPLREVWSIAWPTVVTMTSYTVMQFMDSLMVGQVGPLEVAAQGNAGVCVFVPMAMAMGFLTVVNTFVSQNLGAGTPRRGSAYAWAAVWMSVAVWLLVLLPMAAVLPGLFTALHDPSVVPEVDRLVALETGYGRILLAGALLTLAGRGLHHYFFGLHRPKIITLTALLGNGVNIAANYVLIFGEAGIPAMGLPGIPGTPALGLYGAGIGTVIGTTVEIAIPAAVFLGPRMNAEMGTRAAWRPRLGPIRDLTRIGWPAALQFGNEIACWAIFMTVLVGSFGTDHMTAGWVVLKYLHLSFMPAVGFSVAVTSLVGKYIGAGQPDIAVARARLGVAMAVGYMTCCGALFFAFRHPLVGIFVGGAESAAEARHIVEIGGRLMICAAIFQTIDAMGIVYTGALRGAGDTVWPGVITMVYSWTLIVGGGLLLIRWFPEWESLGPWIGTAIYLVVLGLTMAVRFERGRWRSIRLLGPLEAEASLVAPIGPGPPASEPESAVRDIASELGADVGAGGG